MLNYKSCENQLLCVFCLRLHRSREGERIHGLRRRLSRVPKTTDGRKKVLANEKLLDQYFKLRSQHFQPNDFLRLVSGSSSRTENKEG